MMVLGSGKSLDMWTWIMPNVTFIIGHLESCLIWAESGQFWACNLLLHRRRNLFLVNKILSKSWGHKLKPADNSLFMSNLELPSRIMLKIGFTPVLKVWDSIELPAKFLSSFNHLLPNISRHILHTVLCTFLKALTRRICIPFKSLFN